MGSSSGFLHKGLNQTNSNNDNLTLFFIMQQFFKNGNNARYSAGLEPPSESEKWSEKEEYINATKKKILNLLDNET